MNIQTPSRPDTQNATFDTQPSPQEAPRNVEPAPHPMPDRRLIAGVALILFGMLTLVATVVNSSIVGMSILPLLGVLFIVWAALARLPALMIPGGILTGLGIGILLSETAFGSASGETRGGIIVLGLGLGFLMIVPLVRLVSPTTHWWPFIPGGIITLVGIGLLIGGAALNVLTFLGQLWPVIPIVVGLYLIWQMLRKQEDKRQNR